MSTIADTESLLAKLQALDDEEDRILDVLLRHGAAVEQARRRMNTVSVSDLRPLRDGLAALEETTGRLQASIALAEAASAPAAPSDGDGGGASNGDTASAAGVDTPEPAAMTFEELAERIREQDAQAARLREILRERLLTLGALSPAS